MKAKKVCVGPQCTRPARAKNLCFPHYKQVNYGSGVLTPLRNRTSREDFPEHCTGPECTREVKYAGLCHGHLNQKYLKGHLTPLRPYNRSKNEQEPASKHRTKRAGSPIASGNDGGSK